jgi:hypothetical protein
VPNFNGNWLQLLVVFGFFGFSILTWVVRQLKEKSIARRQQQMREQQRIEALRTGRAPGESSASTVRTAVASPARPPARPPARTPEQRLAEIAARRAAQRQTGSPSSAPARTMPSRTPTAPRHTSASQRSASAPLPRPRPAGGQVPNQPKTTAQRRQEMIEARRRALEARTPSAEPASTPPKARKPEKKQRFPSIHAGHDGSTKPVVKKKKKALTRAQLRRAIILKEILDPPIALRPESDL